MANFIQQDDLPLLRAIPERDIVEMAVDLDICVPEKIDRVEMIEACILAIIERGREEGLPFSQYDQDDLAALSSHQLDNLGKLMQISGSITVAKVLKKGKRVYKYYQKHRPDNATALLIPTLFKNRSNKWSIGCKLELALCNNAGVLYSK